MKTRDREASRSRILQAARDEFSKAGPDGARMSAIAKRAGVPQGLLYHYFDSKEALFHATLDAELEPFFEATTALLEEQDTVVDRCLLERGIRLYFDFLRDNPQVPRLLTWYTAGERWREAPPISSRELARRPRELGTQWVQRAQASGVIRKQLDPEIVFRSFMDLSMFWHQNWTSVAADRGINIEDVDAVEQLHQERLHHIVNIVLHGVLEDSAR